jgi:hypothetical protein
MMTMELGLKLGLREEGPRALEKTEPTPEPAAPAKETFEAALERFIKTCAEYRRQSYIKQFGAHKVEPGGIFAESYQLGMSPGGRRYIRIVSGARGGSVYCFVERETGNVLKSAGWKTPAKHVRGSIFAKEFAGYGVGEHGANYL